MPHPTIADTASYWHQVWLRGNSATKIGQDTDTVFMGLWWFCVAWFLFLMGLMAYFVVKYRRRGSHVAPRSASHNSPLEIAWTIIPSLCLVVMFFYGFWGYIGKLVAPGDAVEMRFTGAKWFWTLTYPNGVESPMTTVIGSKPVPVFYIPASVPIRLRMSSKDVMHAFWVPDYRLKQDVLPNRYMSVWFEADPPSGEHRLTTKDLPDPKFADLVGTEYEDHWLMCAEYCGDEHSEMAGVFRIVPEPAYNRWLSAVYEIVNNRPPCERGEFVWKTKCASCHSVDGSRVTGPSWKNIFGTAHEFSDGSSISAQDMSDPVKFANYVRESVLVPSAKIVKGYPNQMNSFQGQIKEEDIDGVIAYMKKISPEYKGPDPCGAAPATPAKTDAPATPEPKK